MKCNKKQRVELLKIGQKEFSKKYGLDSSIKFCEECGAKIENFRICSFCEKILCYGCYLRSRHHYGNCKMEV